jgi:glycosylphosphatidylinositol phospholipase D
MEKNRSISICDRVQGDRSNRLRGAVRRALLLSTGVIAGGLALGAVATAPNASFPAVFPLGSLFPAGGGDGSAGFVLPGVHSGDRPASVSDAGDVNGDGIDDLIIGARFAEPGGVSGAGESYIVFGRDTLQAGNFPPIFPLGHLFPAAGGDGSAGFVLTGDESFGEVGSDVSAAGDINHDGIDDVIISAPFANPGGLGAAGETFVVFGRDTAQGGNFPAIFPLRSLFPGSGGDGGAGFVLTGIDASDVLGRNVSALGDFNGDGIDDIIISAADADPGGRVDAGENYVVFGRDTGQDGNFPALFPLASLTAPGGGDGSAGFVLLGISPQDLAGNSVSGAGDVNDDGINDLVIGAFKAPRGQSSAGESYVVFGRDTAQDGNFPAAFPLASLLPDNGGDGSSGFVLTGIQSTDYSGYAVSTAGDVNGDGVDDVVVGAAKARGNAGESYVVFGRNTAQVGNFPALLPLASLYPVAGGDGSEGFVLTGIDIGDHSGFPVSGAGDVNDDGIDDLIISARHGDAAGRTDAGESYVVFGRATAQVGNFPPILPLGTLFGGDGSTGFVLTGIGAGDQAGGAASGAGDINGDGVDDLVVCSEYADPLGQNLAGETYVIFGRAAAP